jgi:nucleoside-diphosphate-sugar epimerase
MNYEYTRALVTGGAGFIGSHLVDRLLSDGLEVCVVDNYNSGDKENIKDHFKNSNCMIENQGIEGEGLHDIFRVFRPEMVFHLAAIPGVYQSVLEPAKTAEVNLVGTANVLAMAEKFETKRVLFASSSSVYGGKAEMPTSEASLLMPKSPYALQKYIGEEYCRYYSKNTSVDTVALRLFNVFGPRQKGNSAYSAVIAAFLEAKKKGFSANVYGDGEQTRDFCYVDNVVEAFIQASQHNSRFNGEGFNIAFGERTSVNDLLDMIGVEEYDTYDDRPGDVKDSWASFDKAKSWFGYSPKVSVLRGLELTAQWYLGDAYEVGKKKSKRD